jgi:hypothetical protein
VAVVFLDPALDAVTSLSALTGDVIYAWIFQVQVVFDGTKKPRNLPG